MKRNEIIAVTLMILVTVGTVLGILGIERYRSNKFFTVELTARAPENGNWYPRKIRAILGEEVRIRIRNIDTVTHGFAIPEFRVAAGEIKGGQVKVVKFTPDKRGEFPFMCTVWCSERHMEMKGELIVE